MTCRKLVHLEKGYVFEFFVNLRICLLTNLYNTYICISLEKSFKVLQLCVQFVENRLSMSFFKDILQKKKGLRFFIMIVCNKSAKLTCFMWCVQTRHKRLVKKLYIIWKHHISL